LSQASKRAFGNPATRQNLKADRIGHAPHDLDAPTAEFGERLKKLPRMMPEELWHSLPARPGCEKLMSNVSPTV
jgi:hypothetical protein